MVELKVNLNNLEHRIVLLGLHGAGKGTQTVYLAKRYGLLGISTGEVFRDAMARHTELGETIREVMDAGRYVPDDLTITTLKDHINHYLTDQHKGILLDGFPRTIPQAEALEEITSPTAIIYLDCSIMLATERQAGRRICQDCNRTYHLNMEPMAPPDGLCPVDQSKLIQRTEDRPENIRKRMITYHKLAAPLISFYMEKGILRIVRGDQYTGKVFNDICAIIDIMGP